MQNKSTDELVRKNVSLRESTIDAGERLVASLHKSTFSGLLTDLIWDAQRRHASGEDKNLSELLATIRALEAKLKEKADELKLERKGHWEALRLVEEDLKKVKAGNATH